ncbi:15008_t:CDS:2, partial [Funneliformis geosporum]
EFQGKVAAEIGRIRAGVTTAGGESVDNTSVAPNAGGSFPAVTIALGIKLGQLLYLFRTCYTIVEHLKHTAVFGQLI